MFNNISLISITVFIVSLLVAMTIHEFMHAWVGYKLGDMTARNEGRISLNPMAHIDPLMTIALPIVTYLLFQAPILAAKPVPFNPFNVKYREWGAALIALAGPLSNLALAIGAAIVAHQLATDSLAHLIVYMFAQLNIGLFLFNIIPIPPLDGSRVLYAFLPEKGQELLEKIEPYGFFIVFGLALMGGFGGFLSNGYSFLTNLLF